MNLFNRPSPIPIRKASAARAVFESQDISRIDLTLITTEGDKLKLELHPDAAYNLIQSMTIAYEAIRPPMRSARSAQLWGME